MHVKLLGTHICVMVKMKYNMYCLPYPPCCLQWDKHRILGGGGDGSKGSSAESKVRPSSNIINALNINKNKSSYYILRLGEALRNL